MTHRTYRNRIRHQQRMDMALGITLMVISACGLASLPWLWPLLAQ